MKQTERAKALSYTLALANEYVKEHAPLLDRSKRPSYHLTPEIGWMNDPNGFCRFQGQYHLFWQYNPFSPKWNTMYWGHAVSHDLVKWSYLPIALAPDKPYDWGYGCFSGTAYEENGMLHLMYTCVDEDAVQQQALAVSEDGIHFTKYERNPVLPVSKVPEIFPVKEFRDPFLFRQGDRYYALIGTKTDTCGNIALYRSINMKRWKYVGKLFEGDEGGLNRGAYECPALLRLADKDVLLYSAQFLPTDGERFVNIHSAVYAVGSLDIATGKFTTESIGEVDGGFDFYAPQTVVSEDGRHILIAWMQMWDRDYVTAPEGYVGKMTLPRECSLVNGKLRQVPIREIEAYRQNKCEAADFMLEDGEQKIEDFAGTKTEISFTLKIGTAGRAGIKLFQGVGCELSVYYDRIRSCVTLDRGNCGAVIQGAFPETDFRTRSVAISPDGDELRFRIFLDQTGVEVFLNGGDAVMSANANPEDGAESVSFFAEDGNAQIKDAVKYDIIVK